MIDRIVAMQPKTSAKKPLAKVWPQVNVTKPDRPLRASKQAANKITASEMMIRTFFMMYELWGLYSAFRTLCTALPQSQK